ncbi:transposase [Nocardia sp. CA-119907]|uniref:transposase n=1 Tax=Nocardia sp. CA-119907 TaxID=3239973 RepID=UPI003D9560A9
MNLQRIEARVLDIVTRVVGGGRAEDDSVECKAQWPGDPAKAARRIAAISNAARGDDVIWIVGLDEDGQVIASAGPSRPHAGLVVTGPEPPGRGDQPAGVTTPIQARSGRDTGTAYFGDACTGCTLRAQCTTAAGGRTIAIGAVEKYLAAGRQRQHDPA